MWWHTLVADHGPLAYVLALDFARQRQSGRRYLDFGAGVGADGLLFARHGFQVFNADIQLNDAPLHPVAHGAARPVGEFINLKDAALPPVTFTRHGLFGRFAAEPDPDRPQHIVFEFDLVLLKSEAEQNCHRSIQSL